MDPTLAPGYVPPNAHKSPKSKHHWAEIRESRSRDNTNNSDADVDMEDGTSSPPTRSSPTPSASMPSTAPQSLKSQVIGQGQHQRMASWRGAHASLSDGEGMGADLEEVPTDVKRQALQLEHYVFPTHRLRPTMDGTSRLLIAIPLTLR